MNIIKISPARQPLNGWLLWSISGLQLLNVSNLLVFLPLLYLGWFGIFGVVLYLIFLYYVIFKNRFIRLSWRPARTWFHKSIFLDIEILEKDFMTASAENFAKIIEDRVMIFEHTYDCLVKSYNIALGELGSANIKTIYYIEFYDENEATMLLLQHA